MLTLQILSDQTTDANQNLIEDMDICHKEK